MAISNRFYRTFFLILLTCLSAVSAHAQNSRPVVSDINAYPSASNKITVSWKIPAKVSGGTISSLLVYRDTRPITTEASLAVLGVQATLPYGSVTWTDTVKDYNEYYYAVIAVVRQGESVQDSELYYDEELDTPAPGGEEKPYLLILPGVNSTVQGTKVQRENQQPVIIQQQNSRHEETSSELREQPLPFIDILGDRESFESSISPEAEQNALELTDRRAAASKPKVLEPYVFEEDLISPDSGDEYLLFEVLRTTFIQKKYDEAVTSLLRFLALNRNPQVTYRAKFYLGESFYFSGNFHDALMQFMDLEEKYPSLSQKWMESCLDQYTIQ